MRITEETLGNACVLAYADPRNRDDPLLEQFDTQPFERNRSYALVLNAGNTAIVACRGTVPQHVLNLLTDFRFLKPNRYGHGQGRVHRGFAGGAQELIAEGLLNYLSALDVEHVWFVGHSLGGGIATVLAGQAIEDLWLSFRTVNLFTVGCPRVGTAPFANWLESAINDRGGRIDRIVNAGDIVTQIPPRGRRTDALTFVGRWLQQVARFTGLWGYVHIGETRLFEEDGYLNEAVDQSAELVLRLKQLLDDVRPWNFPVQLARNLTQTITDHFALLYAARLTMRVEYCRATGIEPLIDHEVQAIHATE